MKIKLPRFLSYFFGFITLILPILGYVKYVYFLGFRDGYITDYEHAGKVFYKIFIWFSFGLGLYFINLGWTASKQKINRKLVIAVLMLIFYIIITVIVDCYLYLHLDHGQGG